jgi:uncharacterized protein
MTLAVLINLAVILAVAYGLFRLRGRGVTLSRRVLAALVAGALLGLALQVLYGVSSEIVSETLIWSNVVGSGYVDLLRMVVMPLILVSMTAAVVRLDHAAHARQDRRHGGSHSDWNDHDRRTHRHRSG